MVKNRVKNHCSSVAAEGHPARGHLVEHRPEAEQVRARINFFPPRLLG